MTSALLDGKTAVVTGAAGGIGLAIAELFYAHGASVVLADLNESGARTAAESLGERAIGLGCNVTDEDSVQTLVEETMSWAGGLDVFVNNAGVTRDASLRTMTVADFDTVIAVHLRGTWLGLRAASAVMRDAGHGSIINMSSLSGKSGNPGQTNYSAAKAGIVGMTKAGAKELAHKNVRVNAIQPGLIRTPMTEAMPSEVFAEREAAIPMKRAGEPSEVAGVALFLASDLSSYMTGTVLEVGGGRLM
ncbi:3-oxoacyl-ACP reductase FabG [Nocardia nova]|uniref:3-oxoacyl-ACP reductase FabG n=1 Tax=Nocardia nova TaxID=37330 RepID=UPI0018931CF6|nr:3-oxoacyl-ACP reductase FabG [Nocardia nova]MBF6149496.1 3-oxoacyl-ACP reductase FabG [Nocardia nova]